MLRFMTICLLAWLGAAYAWAEEKTSYLLDPKLTAGESWLANVKLSVGGNMHVEEQEAEEKKLPLTVSAHLQYEEHLLTWSPDKIARSLRHYGKANARIQVEEGGILRELPANTRQIAAEIRNESSTLNSIEQPLTRQQLDLINVVGNTLALQRLLPGDSLAVGEGWDHSATAIGPLLGLDYLAVCEVRSIIVGVVQDQVQIRLSGTVHGTIDGAPTEMELRGAYLFHQEQKRITKFNLAIKELRTASEIVPGLDIVAKISITLEPVESPHPFTADQLKQAGDISQPLPRELMFDARAQGFCFEHNSNWYITAEQRNLVSLRCMHTGNLLAHCNISTLPARSEGRFTSLDQLERDVRNTLGDRLESVSAATHWTTPQGYKCLGVVAHGKVQEVPIEWRYYLLSADGLPRVSLAVTVEQSQLKQFNDGDRQLVDSLKLLSKQPTKTAVKSLANPR